MNFRFVIVVFAIIPVAFGCAGPQRTPYLDQAQSAYTQASNNPTIAQYAPVQLREAADALDQAENARTDEEQRHYVYIAERKIVMAQTISSEKAIEDQARALRTQKENLVLQLRAREAELAQRQAQTAQEQLRSYRSEQQQQELMQAQQEAESAKAEVDELRREIEELQAQQTDRGILLTMGDVLFETDGTHLAPGATLSISKLAAFLQKHPDRQVVIEGHTDDQGESAYNEQLSRERAQAVADALETAGVGRERMTIKGMGENYPVAPNTTAAGRQQNRRVEIVIQNQG